MFLALILVLSVAKDLLSGPTQMIEYEAEDQNTSGLLLGPDEKPGTVAAEASGRRAVWLQNPQQFVKFTLRAPARGITLRYSLPSREDGSRQPSTALIEAAGVPVANVALTSRYSGNPQPPSGLSSDGAVHHFWEEVRVLLPRSLRAGATISIRMSPDARGKPFGVDLIDAVALAPPTPAPRRAISVTLFHADPSGSSDSRRPFLRAIAEARQSRRALYLPPGRYRINGHLIVDGVTVTGPGSWYSVIAGHDLGFYSRRGGSSRVSLSGFAIESDVAKRQDRLPLAAIGGRFSKSDFVGLYLHRAKVGIWLDGPARDLVIREVEVADQAADGINLHRGVSDAVVERNGIRNVGDDAIASWSEGIENRRIRIRGNRIAAVGLANGIAIYGGRDIDVANNRIADTLTEGGGVHLGTRFHSTGFSGTIRIFGNLIVRSGSLDPHWRFGVGAIWLYALEKPISARILIQNNRIEDAVCEAVQLLGPRPISGVRLDRLQITGGGKAVLALQAPGSMYAADVASEESLSNAIVEVPRSFSLAMGARNSGWQTRAVEHADPPGCT